MEEHHKMIETEHDGKKLILLLKVLKRARSRFERKSDIRNPVKLNIENISYLFTKNEIKQGFRNWLDIERLPREEIAEKKNLIVKLSRNRDTAVRLQADQFKGEWGREQTI